MITAIVLAGGRSRRFGGDKLGAELDGVTLLSRAIAALAPLADRVIVAGPRSEPIGAGDTPIAHVDDRQPFGGPLAALANVLEAGRHDPSPGLAIVVGGDMPTVVPAVLRSMLDRLAAEPELDAVILEVPDSPERQVLPLAIRVTSARPVAAEIVDSGEGSLRALVDRLRTAELPAEDWRALDPTGDTLADVDTPSDLDRLRSSESGGRRR